MMLINVVKKNALLKKGSFPGAFGMLSVSALSPQGCLQVATKI
jgi:hypothetical protein